MLKTKENMFKEKHVGLFLINFVPCTPEVTVAEGLCQKVVRVFLTEFRFLTTSICCLLLM